MRQMKSRKNPTAKFGDNLPKYFVLGLFGFGALALISQTVWPAKNALLKQGFEPVAVIEPPLSTVATEGKGQFDKNCATCHGEKAAGTDHGPPFINQIYNPGHHSDEAFYYAVKNGVRQHHWPFGNMPPQPQVDRADVAKIIEYVRELQTANGIKYQPHNM